MVGCQWLVPPGWTPTEFLGGLQNTLANRSAVQRGIPQFSVTRDLG